MMPRMMGNTFKGGAFEASTAHLMAIRFAGISDGARWACRNSVATKTGPRVGSEQQRASDRADKE